MLPDYRTIWRWHFYAGLLCIPFVLWLATTGSIYLFKPQIEAWLDRPYDRLLAPGAKPMNADAQVSAALAAVPGSNLHFYEMPRHPADAPQIIVGKGADEFRVYVHPASGQTLQVVNEDERLMRTISRLHGELMAGDRGSLLVELAASWTIVMILTGLVMWWPRQTARLAGVLYPRLGMPGRAFWKDLHSVTGLWVSFFALFLLFTGLPWAKSWGSYFKKVRSAASGMAVSQDWTTGRSSELAQRSARNSDASGGGGQHDHGQQEKKSGGRAGAGVPGPDAYLAINTILPAVPALGLAYPVQIAPPIAKGGTWTVKSGSQNRMLRDTYTIDGATAAVIGHVGFSDRPLVDRAVSIGISAHEGQLFGFANQLLGLFTAVSLLLLAVSSVILWWRRRPAGILGAPIPTGKPAFSAPLVVIIAALGVAFPLLGASILLVAAIEHLVLRRLPSARLWLGLRPVGAATA